LNLPFYRLGNAQIPVGFRLVLQPNRIPAATRIIQCVSGLDDHFRWYSCSPDHLGCHDPSDTCCPNGTFCSGLRTCCVIGSVGCGEGKDHYPGYLRRNAKLACSLACCPGGVVCCNNACCPNASYVCDTSGSTPTCVDPAASSSATGPGETVTQASQQTAEPTSYPSNTPAPASKNNNTAIIAGSVGGGVGALLILGALAFFLLRKKSSKPTKNGTVNGEPKPYPLPNTTVTPYVGPTPPPHNPNGVVAPYNNAHTPPLPYNNAHTPPLSSPGVNSPHGNNSTNYNRPFSVSTYVQPSRTNTLPPGGNPYGPGPGNGLQANYVPPSSTTTTPPLPEGGANYYANTPIPHLGGGSSTTGTNQPSNYTPSSPPTTVYSETALLPSGHPNSQAGWTSPTSASSQVGANENLIAPHGGNNTLQPPSGVMSPPPPFSPAPGGRGGLNDPTTGAYSTPWAIPPEANEPGRYAYDTSLLGDPTPTSSSAIPAGRVIPSNAPGDRKARPTVGR
jgi:hypothetical protein